MGWKLPELARRGLAKYLKSGAGEWNRTTDLLITNPMCYAFKSTGYAVGGCHATGEL